MIFDADFQYNGFPLVALIIAQATTRPDEGADIYLSNTVRCFIDENEGPRSGDEDARPTSMYAHVT